MTELYSSYIELRRLIKEKFAIQLQDRDYLGQASVSIIPASHEDFPWVSFRDNDMMSALKRAIEKFKNPKKDYVKADGTIWPANKRSCYSTAHIRQFLRNPKADLEDFKSMEV